MRFSVLFSMTLVLGSVACAKNPKPYQTGHFSQIVSVPCGTSNGGNTDCHEYTLQSENVAYRIRPRDQKRAAALIAGERAQFRLVKDTILIRTEDPGVKPQKFIVISVGPVSENSTADSHPLRLNHLQ